MEPKKRELSPAELGALRAFISKKGFGEPALVLEILDHFACKVEELGTQYPTWPLEKLMTESHRQFGVAGFYPLVKSYEEQLQRRYSRYFRKSLLGVFTHARSLGLVILAPLMVYVLSLILTPFGESFGVLKPETLASLLTFIVFAVAVFAYYGRFRKAKNVFIRAVQGSFYGSIFLPGFYFIFLPAQMQVPIPVLALMTALAMIWEQARYATFRKAEEEYHEKVGVETLGAMSADK